MPYVQCVHSYSVKIDPFFRHFRPIFGSTLPIDQLTAIDAPQYLCATLEEERHPFIRLASSSVSLLLFSTTSNERMRSSFLHFLRVRFDRNNCWMLCGIPGSAAPGDRVVRMAAVQEAPKGLSCNVSVWTLQL
eukprot:COSAG06_NODE_1301_length_9938_cov_49.846834_16_plen_133_part_00